MAMNEIGASVTNISAVQRRRFGWLLSGIALRLLIAFIVSTLIILAFFVTGVVSH